MNCSCGPKTRARTLERSPSAPTTRSKVSRRRSPVASSRTTSAVSAWSMISTGRVPSRTSTGSSSASFRSECHSAASMSPRMTAAGSPGWSRKPGHWWCRPRRSIDHSVPDTGLRVCRCSSTPRSRAACLPSGNSPTKYPPVRRSGERSTITGVHPAARSPTAADMPAIPRPTTSARLLVLCSMAFIPFESLRHSVAKTGYDTMSQPWRGVRGWHGSQWPGRYCDRSTHG